MLEHFDSIIGLGGTPAVAHHVRRVGLNRANIFDLWVTPLDAVGRLLDANFTGLFDPDNMIIADDGQSVRCRRYGISYRHDFKRIDDMPLSRSDIAAQIEDVRAKYDILAQRFYARCGRKRVLFVREWKEILHIPDGYPEHLIDGVPRYDFQALIESIEDNLQVSDYRILFLNYGHQRYDHEKALYFNIKNHGDSADMRKNPAGWREAFAWAHEMTV